MIRTLVLVAVGCTIGNFIYQMFAGGDWGVALERSYFQAGALLAAAVTLR
jgi:hypothetical protein